MLPLHFLFSGAAVGYGYCVVTADASGGCVDAVVVSCVNLDITVVGGLSGVAAGFSAGSGATVSSSVNPGAVGGVVVCDVAVSAAVGSCVVARTAANYGTGS